MLFIQAKVAAQTSGAVITTSPASFTAEDEVKIIIDVSAVGNLAGKEPLYMWTWFPSEPPPGNGQWTSSAEERKLTKEGDNKWSVTLKPTDFYGKTPAEIPQIKFLVKAKDGSGDAKSDDIIINVEPLIFIPKVNRVFPKNVGKDDIVTIYLDQTLATSTELQRMTPSDIELSVYNVATQLGTNLVFPLKKQGEKLYSYSFIPARLVELSSGGNITRIDYKFKGTMLDINGTAVPAVSEAFSTPIIPLK